MPWLLADLLMAFDDRSKAAFDAASDTIKQILTLAIGSIGGAVALFDDKAHPGIQFGAVGRWVDGGLVFLALSVVFGLMAMGAKAGQLGAATIESPSTYAPALRLMVVMQMVCFGVGIGLLVKAAL